MGKVYSIFQIDWDVWVIHVFLMGDHFRDTPCQKEEV